MTEEEAVFTLGKRFSELRNQGYDLSSERVSVGTSMVLPEELADEYDRHFPPGPRQNRQDTDRKFHYELVPLYEFRMGAYIYGLAIRYFDREFSVLKGCEVFGPFSSRELASRVQSSKSNRFDVIRSDNWTFVIDKINETISVARASFRIDSMTFSDETPIAGLCTVHIQDSQSSSLACVRFPFVPFDQFWTIWNGYIAFRRSQIHEMQEVLRQPGSPVKGDEVVLRKDHPDHRLQAGSIGTVDDVLANDVYMIRFCGDRGLTFALKGNELLVTQYSEQWRWVRGIDGTTILKPG